MTSKIVFVLGTRPEAIKLAPLIKKFQQFPQEFKTLVITTAQHRQLLDQVLDFFEVTPDYDFNLMRENQSLFGFTADSLLSLEDVLKKEQPDLAFVQGDTTTVFSAALACFYLKIPIAHLEAGLRSNNLYLPFPEEANRCLTSRLVTYHFAPTALSVENLKKENIIHNVWQVGNSVIDALYLALSKINKQYYQNFPQIDFSKKLILVTGHRRENFGKAFENIFQAVKNLVESFADIEVVYPVHLNPNVQKSVQEILAGQQRIHLLSPLTYPQFVWLLSESFLVLTDSGGVQEEAPALGKPVLVTREVTERLEAVQAGTAVLVGSDPQQIFQQTARLLTDRDYYQKMSQAHNPYGDGQTAEKILNIIRNIL